MKNEYSAITSTPVLAVVAARNSVRLGIFM